MSDFNLKTKLMINNIPIDLEILHMTEEVITGFKFNDRIFLDVETVKETIDIFVQMSKPEFWNKKTEGVVANKTDERKETVEEETERKRNRREIRLENRAEKNNINNVTKVCNCCKKTKPLDDFNKGKGKPLDCQPICKTCTHDIYIKRKNESIEKSFPNNIKKKPDIIPLPDEKPVFSPEKNFDWNSKRDSILVANFDSLGVSGIFDKSLLPGFTMTEIRKRCQELHLIDEYGNPMRKRGEASG